MEMLDYFLCAKFFFTMGTHPDKVHRKRRRAAQEAPEPDEQDEVQKPPTPEPCRPKSPHVAFKRDSCDSSATCSIEEDADSGERKKSMDEESKSSTDGGVVQQASPDTTGSRYAFEKSKLARTRTVAVCQRRREGPLLWGWQRDGKKLSSDDNIMISKVMQLSTN